MLLLQVGVLIVVVRSVELGGHFHHVHVPRLRLLVLQGVSGVRVPTPIVVEHVSLLLGVSRVLLRLGPLNVCHIVRNSPCLRRHIDFRIVSFDVSKSDHPS